MATKCTINLALAQPKEPVRPALTRPSKRLSYTGVILPITHHLVQEVP